VNTDSSKGGCISFGTKKRHYNHIIESASLDIIHNILPKEWVIRKLDSDYGIDLNIEIFEKVKDKVYETLGEYIYIQVKGSENLDQGIVKCKDTNMSVWKFTIETPELTLVERMGSAVPVLLFLVDIEQKAIYFICLNDYVEKILLEEDINYYVFCNRKVLSFAKINAREGVSIFAGKPKEKTEQSND
jgi:hypothetical protein